MIKKITTYTGLLLIILATFIVFNAYAFRPKAAMADQWFTYKVMVDQASLPTGIIVENDILINMTSDPLIILNGSQEMWMLKSSKLFYERETGKGFTETTSFKGYDLAADNGKIIDDEIILDRLLENKREDNRPENISLPQPHTFIIYANYKNNPLNITGKVEYQLNPNYNPHKLADEKREQNIKDKTPIIVGAGVIVLLYFIFRRKNKANKI